MQVWRREEKRKSEKKLFLCLSTTPGPSWLGLESNFYIFQFRSGVWFWNKSSYCPHFPWLEQKHSEVLGCTTSMSHRRVRMNTFFSNTALLKPEIIVHPQDQFIANLFDVVDTVPSAPPVLLRKSALFFLHCLLIFTQPFRAAGTLQILVPFCSRSSKLMGRRRWCLLLSSMPGKYYYREAIGLSFCSRIYRSPESHLAARPPNICSGGKWDNVGIVITQGLSQLRFFTILLWILRDFTGTAVL